MFQNAFLIVEPAVFPKQHDMFLSQTPRLSPVHPSREFRGNVSSLELQQKRIDKMFPLPPTEVEGPYSLSQLGTPGLRS